MVDYLQKYQCWIKSDVLIEINKYLTKALSVISCGPIQLISRCGRYIPYTNFIIVIISVKYNFAESCF